MRWPIRCPLVTGIGTCQHKPILVQGDTIANPPGIGLGPEKEENVPDRLVFVPPLPIPSYRLKSRLAAQLDDLRSRVKRDVGRRVDPPDQIVRHACTESVAANNDVDMTREPRKEYRSLSGRIPTTNHNQLFVVAERTLHECRTVVDAATLEMFEAGKVRLPIARAGCKDDGPSINALVMIQSDVKRFGVRAVDLQCIDGHADLGAELATLRQAAAG
jgi:hypothetical protein